MIGGVLVATLAAGELKSSSARTAEALSRAGDCSACSALHPRALHDEIVVTFGHGNRSDRRARRSAEELPSLDLAVDDLTGRLIAAVEIEAFR
jgi:hypothetical protein